MSDPETFRSPTLVFGEAPESDDDDSKENDCPPTPVIVSSRLDLSASGATSSADIWESYKAKKIDSPQSISADPGKISEEMIELSDSPTKMRHEIMRRTYKRNRSFYKSLVTFKYQIFSSTNFELRTINQQLLKSQIELQITLNYVRQVKNNMVELQRRLDDIFDANHIPIINIEVPTSVI